MKRNSVLRRGLVAIAFAVSGLMAGAAVAEETPVIPPDKFVYCTVCHGVQLGGNHVIQAPRVSSLEGWYVERQLRAFRKGWRGAHDDDTYGQEMRPMAAVLSDREITAATEYVSAVESAPPATTIDGDADRGRALYASCAACHGPDAGGNQALASPALTGLNDWYLVTQLANYKAGIRGNHPDDTYGLQMQAAASLLPDEQAIRDVVRYISTLGSP